jgi:hypothetical protein
MEQENPQHMRRPTALGGDGISSQDVWPRGRSSANVMISSRGFTAQQESLTPGKPKGLQLAELLGNGPVAWEENPDVISRVRRAALWRP